MLQKAGLALIVAGFLIGTYQTSIDPLEVDWVAFSPALVLGAIGVILGAIGRKREATAVDSLEANIGIVKSSLEALVQAARKFDDEKAGIDAYGFSARVDADFPAHLDAFVGARDSITHVHGLNTYADVMSHFATGERYLNRVWSASIDGYIDEAQTFVEKARVQFEEAQARLGRG